MHLQSPTPGWLHARIDLPDSPSSAETLPTKRNVSPNNTSDDESLSQEHREDRDYSSYPEATQAAVRARMNANQLEADEVKHQLFHGMQDSLLRLDLRNHIVRMWYRDTSKRLFVFPALESVPKTYHSLAVRVFTFLECTGIINFGAIPPASPFSANHSTRQEPKKHVAIVGAGISGLIAARQLRSFGISVTLFEARNRPGGRISTEIGRFSAPVDLGAMIITGVVQNPVSVLAEQTDSEMHFISSACPLFDVDGRWVPRHTDQWAEREYNSVLSSTARYRNKESSADKAVKLSLGEAFQKSLMRRIRRRNSRIGIGQERVCKEFIGGVNTKAIAKGTRKARKCSRTVSEPDLGRTEGKTNGEEESDELEVSPPPGKRRRSDGNRETPLCERSRRNSCAKPLKRKSSRVEPTGHHSKENQNEGVEQVIADRSDQISKQRSIVHPRDDGLVSRLLRWHIANLEYACAAPIDTVSLKHWDQDDPYAFRGDHVLLKKGFGRLVDALMEGLEDHVRFQTEVTAISRSEDWGHVVVDTKPSADSLSSDPSEDEISTENFDAVLVTVPLGVLKSDCIQFHPPLPVFKRKAINRLGVGGLMKVAMEFKEKFWKDSDLFGALRENIDKRGAFYCFWNMMGCLGKPILLGMVAEPHAKEMEQLSDEKIVEEAMLVLRRCFPNAPSPISHSITRWLNDQYSKGAYTSIPVGSSGDDYDLLAAPVEPFLYFAGEHTCRMNPTTCASGIISGLREAHRIVERFGLIQEMLDSHTASLEAACMSSSANSSCVGQSVEHSAEGVLVQIVKDDGDPPVGKAGGGRGGRRASRIGRVNHGDRGGRQLRSGTGT